MEAQHCIHRQREEYIIIIVEKKGFILPQGNNLVVQLFDCVHPQQPHMIRWPVHQQEVVT